MNEQLTPRKGLRRKIRKCEYASIKNKIFYMVVHPGRVSIVTNNFSFGTKFDICDCVIKNGNLLTDI